MKKFILTSFILSVVVILSACWKKTEINSDVQTPDDLSLSSNELSIECSKTIENYLTTSDKEWTWEEIKLWDNIVVDYIWRLEDWTVFDTSIKSIAESCWIYNKWRDYTSWLSFEVWAWQMIKWFDEWVIWMKIWQTKTVQFWPEKGYGEYSDDRIQIYTDKEIWDISHYEIWMMVQNPYLGIGTITKITNKEITIDFNHELAWKNLIFDIIIKSIN